MRRTKVARSAKKSYIGFQKAAYVLDRSSLKIHRESINLQEVREAVGDYTNIAVEQKDDLLTCT